MKEEPGMKRILSLLLIFTLLLTGLVPAAAAESQSALVLPAAMETVNAEAFMGDASIASVVIPKTVKSIESKAFADCTGLKEVYLGNNADISIAADAFEGCGDIHFYAYPETAGELYALAHGYECDLLEEGSSFLNRAVALVEAHGGTSSILQSAEFAAMRLIVRMDGERLPDISAYNPIEIVRDGSSIFFVQFDSVEETINCYTQLVNDADVVFVEADSSVEIFDEVSAAGTVDGGVWDTEDPMGFDVYAPFVAANGSGKRTIAVIDSGVSKKTAYSDILRSDGKSFAGDNQDWSFDPHVHGSVVASIIKDCVGNANVDILPLRVVSTSGVASLTLIGVAVKYAVACGADIINMSLNFEENAYVKYCLQEAMNSGVTVVVAAGNASRDISKVFPANVSGVVTVSGIDSGYELSATSNYGSNVAYCAPDTYVTSSAYPGIARRGTSFAAPMIAAALALEELDSYHSLSDLRAACRDLGAEGKDSAYGYGLPQLAKLANIYTTGISLSENTPAQMAVGESFGLEWTVSPSNATDKTVTCVSGDEKVLNVETDEDGNVTVKAVGTGTATITVTANNGENVSASATITVVQPVTKIQIVGAKEKLAIGRTLNLTADVQPANATLKTIYWMSTNEAVATVSQQGVVTAISEGTAGIYALATDGYGAQSEVVSINIVTVPDAESVVLSAADGTDISDGSVMMQPGDTLVITAQVLPEDAEQDVVWNCLANPTGAVTVSGGVITASKAGIAIVTATTENGVQGTLNIQCAVMPTGITVSGAEIVDIGTPVTLTATVDPANVTDSSVTWTSVDPEIATVSNSGVVTGVKPGEVQIVATSNADPNIAASMTVTVRQPYTLVFDANGGSCDKASKTAFSGYAVGVLPSPTRDYYRFDGWYTAASGGSRVLETTIIDCSTSYTLYAQWSENELSDWVTEDKVPAGATIVNTKTETTTSTSSSLSGWTQTGSSWKQTGTGSAYYATFPSGFDTTNSIYTGFMKSAYSAYENASTKRTVSNVHTGYVYWHWMYDCGGAKGTSTRAIYNKKGTGPDTGFAYKYFGAWYSTKNYTTGDKYYCNSLSIMNYIVSDQKTSYAECQGALRWFKFNYYTSTYTDYVKNYSYSRKLVQYREK